MTKDFYIKVYEVVKKIPKGKVMTYGQVAKILGTKDARKVGFALHANRSGDVPCHRVVNKEGRLAKNFAFDGEVEQQRRLESEGVVFSRSCYVDLTKCVYNE
jgi:methylated-DNA-protein-cysteine methyltransferase-like protein